MKNILKNTDNAERLLKLTADTLILLDQEGYCVDITVNNSNLWFLKEETLAGRNLFEAIPPSTRKQLLPEFRKVIEQQVTSVGNYELSLKNKTYFFKCIMQPYDDMVLCQYRDITERSQRKLELEKKNHELNEIQAAAFIGNWQYNSGTKTLSYAGHTQVMCSPTPQKMLISKYLEYILPEDRGIFTKWLELNLKEASDQSIDYRIEYQKKIFYIRLKTYAREVNKNGRIHLEGYIQNITDIQQQRNDINLLTHAINNSTEDIYAARPDGTLIFANRSFKERNGIGNCEDISRLKVYELEYARNGKETWDGFVQIVKQNKSHYSFLKHRPLPSAPEVLALEGDAYWVTSDEGVGTVWSFVRDITQRILNEQEINRCSQVLEKTLENLPASIVVKDINSGFKYIYRNRESYNRNVSMREAMGKDDFDYYSIEIAQNKRNQDIMIATTGQELHWIAEEQDMNGQKIFLDKRKFKIESNDFPPILLSIEWDVTEVELIKQELLLAKEKAEASDKLKSAFLANMSHEIRTPLNAIVGFSRIIADSESLEEREEYYAIVEANNERLLQLINEILDLSKIESGIVDFTITPVRLQLLCKEVFDAHLMRCSKDVELVLEPSEEELVIEGDKNRIYQVLSNLIGNALKFTANGSISYGYRRVGENVEFHVSDTGIGIAPDKLDSVFERFVKVNTFAQGTGLGLTICKTIIEKQGGSISVTSKMDEGTTFTFYLPIKTQLQSSKEVTIKV